MHLALLINGTWLHIYWPISITDWIYSAAFCNMLHCQSYPVLSSQSSACFSLVATITSWSLYKHVGSAVTLSSYYYIQNIIFFRREQSKLSIYNSAIMKMVLFNQFSSSSSVENAPPEKSSDNSPTVHKQRNNTSNRLYSSILTSVNAILLVNIGTKQNLL